MSVGAGSIKRAARTAKTGNKAAVITGAEAEVMEAVATVQEKSVEAAEEVTANGTGKAAGRKGKAGKAAQASGKRDKQEKAAATYEAYGIGEQLPVYLL